jgi:4-hydroxybenzoate polyprenyltransferase
VNSAAPAPQAARSRIALWLDLIRWNRPAGWLLLLWPTLAALWIASGGFPGWRLLLVFSAGTVLMRSAGCAVNDAADAEFDRHVQRTARRPVTSGELSRSEALWVGAALALAAFALVLLTNELTVALSVSALLIAVAYPFTKRWLAVPQAYLGIAFSFGIPMAFAAAAGEVPLLAWWLLLGNLFWVLAYDTEYAMVDRADDLKIGIRTSAITFGRFDVAAVMASYALFLLMWLAAGLRLGLGWPFGLGVLAAAAMALWHLRLIRHRDPPRCFTAFRLNHWLGFAVFAGTACAYALR